MEKTVSPASRLGGSVRLPGDKSISHRFAMLTSIAEGTSKILNYSTGADCQSTLDCMRSMGIQFERDDGALVVHGKGLYGLCAPEAKLDAGNSGSTIRMLSGILAAQPFTSVIEGDESLAGRPMGRILKPLANMGAKIEPTNEQFPPLSINGGPLHAIDYTLPVASAQVKSCVLFAGLYADGTTTVRESVRTRDHSELALKALGAEVTSSKGVITIEGKPKLKGCELVVPSDLSSAAFFLVAALIVPEARLYLQNVGLNPTRSALLDFLISMGASIKVHSLQQVNDELIGDLEIQSSRIHGGVIEKSLTAALIDEIPVLAVLGAVSEDGLTVSDASELRVKETDRIAALADNFSRMGVSMEVKADGFRIAGRQTLHGARLDSFGDHRIAMAFSVAALAADGPCCIENAGAASVSFPDFFDTLDSLRA